MIRGVHPLQWAGPPPSGLGDAGFDALGPMGDPGRMPAVLPAHEPDVGQRVVPAHAHGLYVIELEEALLFASPPVS